MKSAFGVEHVSKSLKEGWKVGTSIRGTRKILRTGVKHAKATKTPNPHGAVLEAYGSSIKADKADWSALNRREKVAATVSNQRNVIGTSLAAGSAAGGYGIYRKKKK